MADGFPNQNPAWPASARSDNLSHCHPGRIPSFLAHKNIRISPGDRWGLFLSVGIPVYADPNGTPDGY
jgi:hypothetical protein